MSSAVKNAVVTGANRGLGLELCKQLAESGNYGAVYALCRRTNIDLAALCSLTDDTVKVVEDIHVTEASAADAVQTAFKDIPIHLLVHNAGAYGPPEEFEKDSSIYESQTLATITAERMRFAFELNTLAPLILTQALVSNLEDAGTANASSKVCIISSAMGSIAENGSGGHYAYRSAKAAVNMVGMSLSVDLKDKNIAVSMIHPGFVYTGFGGKDADRQTGQRDVDESARGVVEAINKTDMETTGTFYHGNYSEGVKTMPW